MRPFLSVVTPPASVITLADAKAHLRVESGDDDDVISALLDAATIDLDGATGWLGRALGEQTLALTASHFPGGGSEVDWCGWSGTMFHPQEMRLLCPPIQSVTSVAYVDPAGVSQTLDPTTYLITDGRYVMPAPRLVWPATVRQPGAVTVTYVAGYAEGKLPPPIRAAILLKLGTLYGTRADSALQAQSTASTLLTPYRVFT